MEDVRVCEREQREVELRRRQAHGSGFARIIIGAEDESDLGPVFEAAFAPLDAVAGQHEDQLVRRGVVEVVYSGPVMRFAAYTITPL